MQAEGVKKEIKMLTLSALVHSLIFAVIFAAVFLLLQKVFKLRFLPILIISFILFWLVQYWLF